MHSKSGCTQVVSYLRFFFGGDLSDRRWHHETAPEQNPHVGNIRRSCVSPTYMGKFDQPDALVMALIRLFGL